jgi:hypothetical protein
MEITLVQREGFFCFVVLSLPVYRFRIRNDGKNALISVFIRCRGIAVRDIPGLGILQLRIIEGEFIAVNARCHPK